MYRKTALYFILPIAALFVFMKNPDDGGKGKKREKTAFQTSQQWKPVTDIRADVAIVYGVGGNPSDKVKRKTFEERVQSWRDKGYTAHFMTGIAWGEYQDYFTGKWDGKWHLDEGQVQVNGDTIWHGRMVPYIVPTGNFLKYMKEKHVKRVINAGVDAIYMEEPEFWARAGYSEAFKREWKNYYGFEWRPQHESPENTYLANKLKYQLYYNALKEVFKYAKEYGKSRGMNVRCYVPTHSLVNYSQWMIVSPEASLASLDCVDGYIAQVWTGTSREPNYFNGSAKERVFETAFLEYGSMESMTAPTGRKMFFLTDPIEDRARDWVDYKKNYEATFTAQLLYPKIADYEVMPWPDRIYEGLYRTSRNSDVRERIPRHYSTQMQVMINTLNDMPVSDNKVTGAEGISVLMANSLMFQRFPVHASYDDPQLSNFYGQALPFLKRGVPVKTVHLENVGYKESLKATKVLLMTYSNMKPLSPETHNFIAAWVKDGGVLVYSGRDNDPYQTVQEWWNTGDHKYATPSDHLFAKMNMSASPKEGEYSFGKGTVYVLRSDPKEYVLKVGGDEKLIGVVKRMYEQKAKAGALTFKNNFYLKRGNYDLVSVLNESVSDKPYILKDIVIDLFDPDLPVLSEKIIKPGQQAFLYNVSRIKNKNKAQVLASASRVDNEVLENKAYSFICKSPAKTTNSMRVLLPSAPKTTILTDHSGMQVADVKMSWDPISHTSYLSFENSPEGINVRFTW
ncbi:hypothetical protein [Arcticibacter tournemirensis]|uniref:Beta-galactosidase trimerisation domain-containing protein n=1 Tax=Arcticibacter tournemirensis TaxID=699437 RepID=A0A4Q0MB26_9SPHI|nr:hypothetical protein [Arcticibacter tournemirensis]RXF70223.1 hypothetical protein EKH83_10135 [Arcticibacter tournemirensis]